MPRALLTLPLVAVLAACGQSPAPTPAPGGGAPAQPEAAASPAPATPAETQPVDAAVKHPWASFKPGSYAKMKSTTVMEIAGNKTETVTEMTTKLVDLTPEKAVLEIETKMAALPAPTKTTSEIPLQGEVAVATPAGAPDAPKPVEGEEEVTVAGKTLKCKTMEIMSEAGGAKTTTKTWMSEEVPGFAVKSVMTVEGQAPITTTMELVEYQAM